MNLSSSIPVLTYHQVGRFTPDVVRRQRGNYVDAGRFTVQVEALARLGFQAVTLAVVGRWLGGKAVLPRRPVVFTFDDAYTGVLQYAYPTLARFGWPATTFAVTGELGGVNRWDLPKGIAPAPLLGADELRELARAGWEIGAHSRSHPRLPDLTPEQQRGEIAGSRQDLEAVLGFPVTSWCYPYGALNEAVVDAVREAGFQAAVTLRPGRASSRSTPLGLPRVHIGYRLSLPQFLWRIVTTRKR